MKGLPRRSIKPSAKLRSIGTHRRFRFEASLCVEPVCWTQPQDSFPYGWDHYGVIAGDNPLGRTADTGSTLKGNSVGVR
jgi:hypothetical protein